MTRKATPRQLANLARGREKLFQKQLKQHGINPNYRPASQVIIQREVVRQPTINHTTPHSVNVKLALFNSFLKTKLFTIETKTNKETLNLKEMINRIDTRLNIHWQNISVNKNKIDKIIAHINAQDNKNKVRFRKLEKRIEELEKNLSIKEGPEDEQ